MNSFVNFNKMEKLGTQTMELKFLYIYTQNKFPLEKGILFGLARFGRAWYGIFWKAKDQNVNNNCSFHKE